MMEPDRAESGMQGGTDPLSGFGKAKEDASIVRRFFGRDRGMDVAALKGAVDLSEVKALMRFVTERALDPEAKIIAPLHDAVAAQVLASSREGFIAANAMVLKLYAELCELTYPSMGVNGRTVRNTSAAFVHMAGLILVSLLFVSFAMASEIVQNFNPSLDSLGGVLRPDNLKLLKVLFDVAIDPLSPFFWGGVGSCMYLLKTLSDKLSTTTFDSQRLQSYGYLTRILIGAVLGYVIATLVFTQAGLETRKVGPDAIGFLSGLGVKAVYGGLEALINSIYRRVVVGLRTNAPDPVAPKPTVNAASGETIPKRPPKTPLETARPAPVKPRRSQPVPPTVR